MTTTPSGEARTEIDVDEIADQIRNTSARDYERQQNLKEQMAREFARQQGWTYKGRGVTPFSLWLRTHRNLRRIVDHPYTFRGPDGQWIIAAHLYNVPRNLLPLDGFTPEIVTNFPSWHYPGWTILVLWREGYSDEPSHNGIGQRIIRFDASRRAECADQILLHFLEMGFEFYWLRGEIWINRNRHLNGFHRFELDHNRRLDDEVRLHTEICVYSDRIGKWKPAPKSKTPRLRADIIEAAKRLLAIPTVRHCPVYGFGAGEPPIPPEVKPGFDPETSTFTQGQVEAPNDQP